MNPFKLGELVKIRSDSLISTTIKDRPEFDSDFLRIVTLVAAGTTVMYTWTDEMTDSKLSQFGQKFVVFENYGGFV